MPSRRNPTGAAPTSTNPPQEWPDAGTARQEAGALQRAPRMARVIVLVVFCAIDVVAFLRLAAVSRSDVRLATSGACMTALLALQLLYVSRPTNRPRPPLSYVALAVQAALVYLPLLHLGQAWTGQPGFLAGSVLLLLPARRAWVVFGLIVASMAVVQDLLTGKPFDIAYTAIATVITGLVVYGLTRLATLVIELQQARTELARMAVAQERLRFARDLHDLLGYSLSAITLKSELTHRLMVKQPERAQEELSAVLDISRRALADVRSVASGYRELSLDAEAESVRSVLEAADLDVHMSIDYGHLPVPVSTMLATVLREGVTNMLRHSKAEWCEITVRQASGQVSMDMVNDGVSAARADPARHGGTGIQNLSVRVASLGGRLTAGVEAGDRFRLHAAAPVGRPG
jgi:two-component system sensor histidine kinase DesK